MTIIELAKAVGYGWFLPEEYASWESGEYIIYSSEDLEVYTIRIKNVVFAKAYPKEIVIIEDIRTEEAQKEDPKVFTQDILKYFLSSKEDEDLHWVYGVWTCHTLNKWQGRECLMLKIP
jgi:hypothetical protein